MKVKVGFGLGMTATGGSPGETLLGVIDACEEIGWDSIWFSERVAGDVPDPLAAMAATAARTRKLKFGPSVLVLPGRNPVLLAKELATIDALSGGRFVAAFGLGSNVAPEHEIFAVDRRERAARTDEAAALIRRLWTEDNVTHEGRYYRVRDLTLRPRPAQQDPPPDIWFGGHSDAACRRVGRLGTGWLPSFIAPGEYRAKVDRIRAEAEACGREIEEDHYGALLAYVRDPAAGERVLELAARRRPEVDPRGVVVIGGDDELRARLEAYIDAGATKFVVVPAGPPPDWREELARLHEKVVRPVER